MVRSIKYFLFETLRALRALFISGILIVVPLGITIWIVVGIFNLFDKWYRVLINKLLDDTPEWMEKQPDWLQQGIEQFLSGLPPYGVGFILTVAFIFFAGFATRLYFGQKLLKLVEWAFHQIPGVSIVYRGLKQVVEQLVGRGRIFERVVLIEYPRKGIYSIAFVTGKAKLIEPVLNRKMYYVFVATSPNPTSGIFIMVPEEDMIDMDIPVEDAMKLVISSGMVAPPMTSPAELTAALENNDNK